MGVQFLALTPGSRPMLEKLLECKHLAPRFTPPVASIGSSLGRGTPDSVPGDEPPALAGSPTTWIDDQGVREAIDRARSLACKVDEDLEALLVRDRRSPSPDEALVELPRLLGLRR
jgi:hypothetical protein